MDYYRGQRLRPTPHNPVKYSPHDFAIYEGTDSEDKLIITVVQKRTKHEPASWWTNKVNEASCGRHCLALYAGKVKSSEILELLRSLPPRIPWEQLPPAGEPLNPYRYEGFFNGVSQILELEPDLVNSMIRTDLESSLRDIIAGLFA